jgi:hypothetical protein
MSKLNVKSNRLPGRELCYNFAIAMYFGQQLEVNLRAILYAIDYHGWVAGIELDKAQTERFTDTETFIDGATCGLLIKKLRDSGLIPNQRAHKAFVRACEHRNKLAHTFLSQQNFDTMTEQLEGAVVQQLQRMALDLYQAVVISRAVKQRAEIQSDVEHKLMRELMQECGIDCDDNPNRKFETRKRMKKSG